MNKPYARSHPFGKLLERFRLRRPGFTQAKLAERVGYDPSVIAKMCQGKSALTGPTGRGRVLRILGVLREIGAISRLEEANALLEVASMPPLFERLPTESQLIAQLRAAAPVEPMALRSRGNLPVQLTSFVGREEEIASLVAQIRQHHLLTLTGVGGAGKTRLAQEVAAAVQNDFADGVWWVELAALTEPALIEPARLAQTITQVLRLPEQPERTHTEALLSYFETRQLLLILDNCEHLIVACAELVHTLLRACPLLRILVTSREALNIPGEVLWSVPPLAVDQASQLFVERAQALQPGFVRDEQNAGVIAQVCTRLDGLPLAIELAAVRLRGLPLAQIAARLDDRFGLLTSNHRVALPRHQTLRTMIDWSHDLLAEPERKLFRQLAVFRGGWTLEAAEVMCAERADLTVLDVLTQLVQKSLVVMDQREENGDEPRYHFLETIREYAEEKLVASGEMEVMHHQHAVWLLQLTQVAEPQLHSHQQKQWLDRLEREHDNFRAALRWSQNQVHVADLGLQLAVGLWQFWWMRSHFSEGRKWLEALLETADVLAAPQNRAQALLGIGILAHSTGEYQQLVPRFEEALTLFRDMDDKKGMVLTLAYLGDLVHTVSSPDRGTALAEESMLIARQLDDFWGTALSLSMGSFIALHFQPNLPRILTCHQESLAISQRLGDGRQISMACGSLAVYQRATLDFARSIVLSEQSLQAARDIDDRMMEQSALQNLAESLRCIQDYDRAEAMLNMAYQLCLELGVIDSANWAVLRLGLVARDRGDYALTHALFAQCALSVQDQLKTLPYPMNVMAFASLASAVKQPVRAAKLFGCCFDHAEKAHITLFPNIQLEYEPYIATAREQLGEVAFAAAWAEGGTMTWEQAIEYALGESP